MKLKQQPDDFQVEERTDVTPGSDGPFALYRLEKEGWTTPDALAVVRRAWRIDLNHLSFGGLKDRHARTTQHVTIFRGPRRNFTQPGIHLRYLGEVTQPFTSKDIRANRFRITLRDLDAAAVEKLTTGLAEVAVVGVPNYFDDQRFGSVAGGGDFMARAMVREQYEESLKLALTAPYAFDRAAQKQEKALLLKHWGDWRLLQRRLPRGDSSGPIDYLAHRPGDFRGALVRLRPELRGLYLSAYQSYLWNRMLTRWLERHCPAESLLRVTLRSGPAVMHRSLPADLLAELAALELPLPTARLKADPTDARMSIMGEILAEEGIELKQLRLRGCRELFFSRGERAAWCRPSELHADVQTDERNVGRHQAIVQFELPRGCYATLVVKRLLPE